MLIEGIAQRRSGASKGNVTRAIGAPRKNSLHELEILFVNRFVVSQAHPVRFNQFWFAIFTAS